MVIEYNSCVLLIIYHQKEGGSRQKTVKECDVRQFIVCHYQQLLPNGTLTEICHTSAKCSLLISIKFMAMSTVRIGIISIDLFSKKL